MVDFTNEELEMLKKLILNAPVQGTIQSLPPALKVIASIYDKLEKASAQNKDS